MSSSHNLKEKTVKGMSWSAVDSIASQGITFLVGLVLARLLSPAEYGLIGMITIFISVSNTIVDSGFSNAIIRKKDATEEDYSTTFVFNIVLSIFMYAVLFLCSPLIASFFSQEKLTILTRVLGVVIIINSLAIVQRTKLTKSIDFKRQAKISVVSSAISGIVGIAFAFWGLGVWALVAQQISRQLVNAIGLWISTRWKPSFKFSINSFKYQFNYGWKLLASQLLSTIWNEAGHIVIGRCYSAAALGQFSRANQFSSLFSTNLSSIILRVSFPVLSSIQDDESRLKAGYKKLIKTSMFISFVGMLSLAACAKPLIYVLIGEKWAQASVYLPIICYNLMLYPARIINTNMLQVKGRSDKLLILEIIKKVIAIGPLLLGVFVSIYWMLWGGVFAGVIGYFLNSSFSGKYIRYTTWQQFIDILPSLVFGIVVAATVYCVTLFGFSSIVTLLLQVVLDIALIVILGEAINFESYKDVKGVIMSEIKKVKKRI